MPRIRSIKPDFFVNDEMAEHDPLVRLFFIGLWTQADREGRLELRPKRLKAALMPYDNFEVEAALAALESTGHVTIYEADGARFVAIESFARHQSPNIKEPASVLPEPAGQNAKHASTMPAPCQHHTSMSLMEGKGEESKGEERNARDDLSPTLRKNLPPCLTDKPWKFDGIGPHPSAGHLLRAIESKKGGIVAPADIGLIGKALSETCPKGCTGKSSRDCAIFAIDKITAAFTLKSAADFIRTDRGGA